LPAPAEPVAAGGYWEARQLVAAAGIPVVEGRRAETLGEALASAAAIGYPVALKALGLLHKSDSGGVKLDLAGRADLVRAWRAMEARLGRVPCVVERMAPVASGGELIIGCRRDARFGPVALAGIGGIHAELLGDIALALAPVTEAEAAALIATLAGAPLLLGVRGRPRLDVDAAARALAALSAYAAAHPEIREVEVNPLLVLQQGVLALDARVIVDDPGGSDELER
jgi:hypothetical protein